MDSKFMEKAIVNQVKWLCSACGFEMLQEHEICLRCSCPRNADETLILKLREKFDHSREPHQKVAFHCAKCGGHEKESGELRASGGVLSSMFDISTNRFYFVTCRSCGYTEFYRADIGSFGLAAEFLGS